jgi:hypothetical protein
MNWTNNRPSADGWYWFRETGPLAPSWKQPEPVRVFWYEHDACWHCGALTLDLWLNRFPGQFAGPIPEPRGQECGVLESPWTGARQEYRPDTGGGLTERAVEIAGILKDSTGIVLTVAQVADIAEHLMKK